MERDPHFFTIVIDVHMAGTARRALDILAEPIVPDQNLLYRGRHASGCARCYPNKLLPGICGVWTLAFSFL
jgi:hypothetical protein